MKSRRGLIALIMVLLLVLGLFLGSSITSFILFLNKNNNLLAILSYLCLAIFTLLLILLMFIMMKYREVLFKKSNEDTQYEEK